MASTFNRNDTPKGRSRCSPQSDGLKSSIGLDGSSLPSMSDGRNLSINQIEQLSQKASKLQRKAFRALPPATRAKYRASVRRYFHQLLKSEPSWIYIVTNPAWPSFCKIGVTQNIKGRVKTYRVSSPYGDYECVHAEYFHEHDQYINSMYEHFGEARGHGEWFEVTVADASAHLTLLKEQANVV